MRDLRRGRAQALGVLFDRYGQLVLRIASKILRDDAEGEDLTQEVFLEIYRKAVQYDASRGSVKTWLLQYAYHRSFNRRKYLAFRRFYDDYPAEAITEAEWSGETGKYQKLSSSEWRHVLGRAMQELTAGERRLISLVAFDGLTIREAAERLGESYVNGRNLYYRGVTKLREFLGTVRATREAKNVKSRPL